MFLSGSLIGSYLGPIHDALQRRAYITHYNRQYKHPDCVFEHLTKNSFPGKFQDVIYCDNATFPTQTNNDEEITQWEKCGHIAKNIHDIQHECKGVAGAIFLSKKSNDLLLF